MPEGIYLAFDFGYKRIGVAVGQRLTKTASPLETLTANQGKPSWDAISALVQHWRPKGFIVGLPTRIDGSAQYTTVAAQDFAQQLKDRFALPVFLVDERLTTVEARTRLFEQGGYRKIKQSQVDSVAAVIILEQWLQHM